MLLNRQKEMPDVGDPEIARKTEHRLVELLFQNSEFALYALMAIGFGFWWIFTQSNPYFWPSIWLIGFILLQLFRLCHIRSFLNQDPENKANYSKHIYLFWLLSFSTTLVWSSALVFFSGPDSHQFITVFSLVTGGIACVAMSSLAHFPKIYPTYITGMLVPVSVHYISTGLIENIFAGVTALLFIGFGAFVSRRFRRNVAHSISLELTNLKLAETLQSENSKADKLNADLRQEVGKREQTEKDLNRAIDEARAASKAKSDFLAVISHEIRTPMNGVMGMLDLVTDTQLSKLQRDYLETANKSAETLLRLLNDLLDFSKCDQGDFSMEKTAFLMRDAAEEVLSLMAGRAKKKGLDFKFIWDETAPEWVSGDPIRFRQILGNLVGNAVKFTENGAVTVALVHHKREGELIRYFFKIEDSGIGIDSAAIDGLFEPFTQADTSMTRRYGGTGLGLAISRRLIRLMDGDIKVSSEANKGSCFCFDLLLGEPGPFEIERGVESRSQVPSEARYTGRVLVIEDDTVNQRVIRLLLERSGLEVVVAENGKIGFEKAISEYWDLVFMDCHMPVMDGITATRKIREHETQNGLSHTNIVALTANAKESDKEACLVAGMDDFLSKPVRKSDLKSVLDAWFPEAVILRP